MQKEPCTTKTIKRTLTEIFLSSSAFIVYSAVFSWFSFGWIAAQIWRFGGLSFDFSAMDITRVAVGIVGCFVCIFISFKTARKSCKECEATE